ncbi:MAG TPA: PHP domain-containing protein [Dehalococcoidales bacterium]|nr:PHP domain-containing protein [Dehalococcoidales bacterium]
MGRVDLHVHSTASDGRLTPAEVIREAAERGLAYIALTDHDTVDGIATAKAAAQRLPNLIFIPGIEISTDIPQGEVHILGYFFDYADPQLLAQLEEFKDSRLRRAEQMVAKLAGLGVHIGWQRVLEIAGASTIGRPHIARAMLEKGYVPSFKKAFDKYLGHGKPAYVEREKMLPAEAVAIIVRAGGLPVLAHPLTTEDPEGLLAELKPAGLVGMEAYYGDYSDEEVEGLVALAQKHDLIATGGSDFHGIEPDEETPIGGSDVPLEAAERLIALAKEKDPKLIL